MAGVSDVGTVAVAVVEAGGGGHLDEWKLTVELRVARRVSVVVGIVDEADFCDILKRSLGSECVSPHSGHCPLLAGPLTSPARALYQICLIVRLNFTLFKVQLSRYRSESAR